MKNIELLAPVGSFESLKAAVQNGADAVYLGGKEFSARASANNFTKEELKEAVEYAHTRGCQVFVTANTLIKENEIKDFLEYAKYLYDIDVDAIILQDIGMAKLLKTNLPDFELHASTQMVAHSLEDVKYLESVGFDRVVLAREVKVSEIEYICKNSKADIEVFVHGALCVSYSGQCFMSSMIGNRSGNRGRCAQPCRQKYSLIDYKTKEVINTNGEYLLSQRDLNTICEIDKVIEAGVYSLKIEGRMKKPEYVATVVKSYRQTIDDYLKTKKVQVSDETINNLYTIFNRKFTKGLLLGDVGADTMNSNLPNNIGLFVGTVVDYNKKTKKLKIKLSNTLKKGDGINLGGGTIGRIIKNKSIETIAHKGETVEIDFVGEAYKNQIVYKTSDSELLNSVKETFESDKEFKKTFINAKLQIKLNQNPVLILSDFSGNVSKVVGANKVEKALKVALTTDKIKTQLNKLNNTPYIIKDLEIDLDENVSMPISEINNLRRIAVNKLSEERVKIKNRKFKNKVLKYEKQENFKDKKCEVSVKVKNLEQLQEVLNHKIKNIYYEDIKTINEAIELAKTKNQKIIFASPRIIRFKEYNALEKIKDIDLKGIMVSNWGSIEFFKNKDLYIDYFLHNFNSESLNYFENINSKSICISQELNLSEIKQATKYSNTNIESVVYGYMPVMITEYCPMGVLTRNCKKDKRTAKCSESIYALRNLNNEEFKVSQDLYCRSTIYNSSVTMAFENLEELKNSNINVFRLDFTLENKQEVKEVIEAFNEVFENNFKTSKKYFDLCKKLKTTSAHYFKGVE